MSRPKQTLGYPSRGAAVAALRAQGLSTREIAARIGITTRQVLSLECDARLRTEADLGEVRIGVMRLDAKVARRAKRLASHRGVDLCTLCRRLIETAIRDGLVNAILDDAPEPHMRSQSATSSNRQTEEA